MAMKLHKPQKYFLLSQAQRSDGKIVTTKQSYLMRILQLSNTNLDKRWSTRYDNGPVLDTMSQQSNFQLHYPYFLKKKILLNLKMKVKLPILGNYGIFITT